MEKEPNYVMSPFNRAFAAWLARNNIKPGTLARLSGFEQNTVKHLANGKSQYPVTKTISRLVQGARLMEPTISETELEKLQKAFGEGLEDQEAVDFHLILREVRNSRKEQKDAFNTMQRELTRGNDALVSRLDALIKALDPGTEN